MQVSFFCSELKMFKKWHECNNKRLLQFACKESLLKLSEKWKLLADPVGEENKFNRPLCLAEALFIVSYSFAYTKEGRKCVHLLELIILWSTLANNCLLPEHFMHSHNSVHFEVRTNLSAVLTFTSPEVTCSTSFNDCVPTNLLLDHLHLCKTALHKVYYTGVNEIEIKMAAKSGPLFAWNWWFHQVQRRT